MVVTMHRLLDVFNMRSCGMLLLLLTLLVVPSLMPTPAYADNGESTTCAKQLKPSSTTPGKNIVAAVFNSINAVLAKVGQTMYKGIIANPKFQNAVSITMSLYVCVFGVLIMLGMIPMRMGEVITRLIRVAIIYGLLSNVIPGIGWVMFDQFFSAFFMGGMNELIFNFAIAAGVPVVPPVTVTGFGIGITPTLDVAAVSAIYGPMNVVYQPFYFVAFIGLMGLNMVCTIMALALMWAFWDFTMMILGALITYIRSIVGLTFLFGIAPLFLIFLLFGHTRTLFLGWVSQCLSMALAPVLMFAFLSFYTVLLTNILTGLFVNVDFCWGRLGSMAGTTTDIGGWTPAMYVPNPASGGNSWVHINGAWKDTNGVDLPPPFSIVSVLLFVVICHLGKNFTKHIETISSKISEGIGPGIVSGDMAGQFVANKVTGGRGFQSLVGGAFSAGSRAPIKSASSTSGTIAETLAGGRAGPNK